MFSPVPVEAYLDSIRGDLDWILDGNNLLGSPYYGCSMPAGCSWSWLMDPI